MIKNLIHDVVQSAKDGLGINLPIIIAALVVAFGALGAIIWLSIAAFIWLAQRYDSLMAALVIGIFYLLVAVAACLVCVVIERRAAVARAEREKARAAEPQMPNWMLDPRVIAIGLELGRSIGLKRLIPIAAVGVLAALGTREWVSRPPEGEPAE